MQTLSFVRLERAKTRSANLRIRILNGSPSFCLQLTRFRLGCGSLFLDLLLEELQPGLQGQLFRALGATGPGDVGLEAHVTGVVRGGDDGQLLRPGRSLLAR